MSDPTKAENRCRVHGLICVELDDHPKNASGSASAAIALDRRVKVGVPHGPHGRRNRRSVDPVPPDLFEIHESTDIHSPELRGRSEHCKLTIHRRQFLYCKEGIELALLAFDLRPAPPKSLPLYELWVAKEHRGHGIGTAALQRALELTHSMGRVRLLVRPHDLDGTMTQQQLWSWYLRRGFKPWPSESGVLSREVREV